MLSLWRNLVRRDRVERDLEEELRAAFELLIDEKVHGGMRRADARRAATRELGRLEGDRGADPVRRCPGRNRSGTRRGRHRSGPHASQRVT
jgi:hypothetical protein